MGNCKPILMELRDNNRGRRSKEFIKDRIELEKSMQVGKKVFRPTQKILSNKYSIAKWRELVKLYKDYEHVTNIDTGAIEQYCLTHAAYYELLDTKEELNNKGWDRLKTYHAAEEIKLNQNINKALDMLIKLEDRLFLNPVSRVKNIPKKEPKKEKTELEKIGFGMV